ncbi:MAG TPA: aldo/keto reductase [Aggregatilineales bacterium]|nr:aldo/keto reductase [Aggregatilineales bacterium]
MQYARLGRTGLQVSRICLGTMNFGWSVDEADSRAIMDAAFDAGINFFDTADIYSSWAPNNPGGVSEQYIGRWMKTKSRRDLVLATKVRGRMWPGVNGEGLSRQHIILAVEDSLRRLDTDTIDLYQTHWFDANTPIDETLAALDHLVQSGKVLYVGCSNYPAWRLMKALWVSDQKHLVRYDSLQPHYSLFNRAEYERELADVCSTEGVGVIPYSPLAAGFATGKYTRENRTPDTTRSDSGLIKRLLASDQAFDALDLMQQIASGHGVPVAQVALAWILTRPAVASPIIGARSLEQLAELVGATEVTLSASELDQLTAATDGF